MDYLYYKKYSTTHNEGHVHVLVVSCSVLKYTEMELTLGSLIISIRQKGVSYKHNDSGYEI